MMIVVLPLSLRAQPQSREPGSLGELARRLKAERKGRGPEAVKVFTNDNIPHHGGITVMGQPPPQPGQEGNRAAQRSPRRVKRAVNSRRNEAERHIPCLEASPRSGSWQVPEVSQVALQPSELGERVVHARRSPEERSAAARDEFKRECPCPSTGKTQGSCAGYIADHIVPLACGGADAPSNMQWQTEAEGKAKDKWERKACGK
jgi:hypothetical protein